ncbi:MAG: hypothetical protein KDD69_11075 [Bdellovibrionales bacterium]|nr:hypothetical protein [Bdellovibrionales bacterium]
MSTIQNAKAASLLELLVGMALAAIALGGVMQAGRALREPQLRQETARLMDLLRQEARTAYYLGTTRRISFARGSSEVAVERSVLPAKLLLLARGTKIEEARFGTPGAPSEVLEFRETGAASPGRIVLRAENGVPCRIFVGIRGSLRSECAE